MFLRILLTTALTLPALFSKDTVIHVLDKNGKSMEGPTRLTDVRVTIEDRPRKIAIGTILSIQSGEAASAYETERIAAAITSIQGTDRKLRDAAVEELTAIGIPALTPLLKAYKDTDQHEPRPLYRLFERIMPSYADTFDRELSMIRLVGGETLRGKVEPFTLDLNGESTGWDKIRRLAVRQKMISRATEIHSLRHCTQIEYLDSGVILSSSSTVYSTARGFVRLSWDVDGWASDPDGLKKPGPNYKTNLVDGHPFGALVARVGATGEVILAASRMSRTGLPAGRLYFAINDNRHWQNNLGTFRLSVKVTNAYDLGDPQ